MSTFDGTLLSLKDFQTGISAAESLEKGGRDGFVAKYVNEQSELAVGVVEEVKKPSRLGKQKTNFPLRSHVSNLAKFQSRISLKKSQTGAMFKNSRISGIVKIGNHCIEIPKDNPGQEPLEAIASPHFEKKQDQRDNIHPSRDQNQHANIRNLVTSDSAIATNTEAVKESTCFPQQKEQFRYVDPRLPPIRADQTQQQMESRSAQQCNQPEEQDQEQHQKTSEVEQAQAIEVKPYNVQPEYEFDVDEFEAMFAPKQDQVDIPQFYFPHRIY